MKEVSHHDLRAAERGVQKISELKLVMNEMIEYLMNECGDDIKTQYENSRKNVEELTKCFEIAKVIYMKENKTRRLSQMSWESFVKDARRLKKERLGDIVQKKKTAKPRAKANRNVATNKPVPKRKATPKKSVAKRGTYTVPKRRSPRNISLSSSSTSRLTRKASQMNHSQATINFGAAFGNIQEKVSILRRTGAGCFESVKCSECGVINTNHRCMFEVTTSGYMDGTKRICGIPFCRMCAGARGCEDGVNRCSVHM